MKKEEDSSLVVRPRRRCAAADTKISASRQGRGPDARDDACIRACKNFKI